jgi:hypothetical protein
VPRQTSHATKSKKVMTLPFKEKYLSLVESILKHKVFHQALIRYFEKLSPLDKREVIEIMNSADIHNVNSSNTIDRRASTVLKWMDWILDLV